MEISRYKEEDKVLIRKFENLKEELLEKISGRGDSTNILNGLPFHYKTELAKIKERNGEKIEEKNIREYLSKFLLWHMLSGYNIDSFIEKVDVPEYSIIDFIKKELEKIDD